jgi:aspartate aminotransferase-like enzyme
LALCGVADRAMQRAEKVPNRGWYFDLLRLEKHRIKNSTPATPAVSLIYALDFQFDRILDQEGLENRFARHRALAERTWEWAENKGWPLFAQEGYRSHSVTTVTNPPDFDLADFNKFAATRDLRLANGYGDFKGKMFRVAHMGEIQMADLDLLLTTLDDYWAAK